MAVSCMHNASDHNYRNSSFIVDLVMGMQIPRSRERISSYMYGFDLRIKSLKNILSYKLLPKTEV